MSRCGVGVVGVEAIVLVVAHSILTATPLRAHSGAPRTPRPMCHRAPRTGRPRLRGPRRPRRSANDPERRSRSCRCSRRARSAAEGCRVYRTGHEAWPARARTSEFYPALVRVWAAARKQVVRPWARGVTHPLRGRPRMLRHRHGVCAAPCERAWRAAGGSAPLRHSLTSASTSGMRRTRASSHGLRSSASPIQLLRVSTHSYRWERRVAHGAAYAPVACARVRGGLCGQCCRFRRAQGARPRGGRARRCLGWSPRSSSTASASGPRRMLAGRPRSPSDQDTRVSVPLPSRAVGCPWTLASVRLPLRPPSCSTWLRVSSAPRSLDVGHSFGVPLARGAAAVKRGRMARAAARLRRVKRWPNVASGQARVIFAFAAPEAHYGTNVAGVAPPVAANLARRSANAAGNGGRGVALGLAEAVQARAAQRSLAALGLIAPLVRYARE